MRWLTAILVGAIGLSSVFASPALACPPDSAQVGQICVDKYEASVWETTDATLIRLIRSGNVTNAQLLAGGAIQRGVGADDYPCADNGNDCATIYAVSIPGVTPAAFITWFQAQQAAANSGKRLLTNDEWQTAAAGTPDGAPCIVGAAGPGPTGTADCVSRWGVFDMVGNITEWVAEWLPLSTACPGWGGFSFDHMCLAGASTGDGPGALARGGDFSTGSGSGVFAVYGNQTPDISSAFNGFRAGH